MSSTPARRRIRIGVLRVGYVTLALSFASLAAAPYAGALLPFGLLLALVGGGCFAFTRDELPRYAGLTLLVYFVVALVVFFASTPVTLRSGGSNYFVNDAPPAILTSVFQDLLLGLPIVLGAALCVAVWEREWAPRLLVLGALVGSAIWFVLVLVFEPGTAAAGVNVTAEQATLGASTAQTSARLMDALLALSGLCGAAGALWAFARPDEYA